VEAPDMAGYEAEYKAKRRTVEEALSLLKNGDLCFVNSGSGTPSAILSELHKVSDMGICDLELQVSNLIGNYPFLDDLQYRRTFFVNSWFHSSSLKGKTNISYTPQNIRNSFFRRNSSISEGRRKVLFATCSPMDRHGYFSISVSNVFEKEVAESGAIIIVETSPHYPRTFGNNLLHISEVAAIVETGSSPPELISPPCSEQDLLIGERIAELVEDGATIQLGIGRIPNAVGKALRSRKDLGIHTEMLTESMMELIECGAVNNSCKPVYRGKSVCCFAWGSRKLYDFIDDNPSIVMEKGNWTNDPNNIARNPKMVSINTTIEMDLTGQCCSESIGPLQYSGTGGQTDTALGAQLSEGGKSVIAFYSTAEVSDGQGGKKRISKIVPALKRGAAVTLSRNDVDHVVTEYGTAWLRGSSLRDRVRALVGISHPDFREDLLKEARELGYI
jgi:acyl-CoA hydrolase